MIKLDRSDLNYAAMENQLQENNNTTKSPTELPACDRMTGPLVTTIIPTYRHPKLLHRAIKSVLDQTYPYFQVCVYDNASGDETPSVVAQFQKKDSRVKYHCHRDNIGAAKNFLYGMEHVETPFFSFLSDDDFLFKNFFTDAMEALKQTPEAICFCGGTLNIDFDGNISRHDLRAWKDGVYYPPNGLLEMLRKQHPTWQSTLFRREVIGDIGVLDPEILAIDYDYLLRIAAQKTIVVSKKPCGVFQKYPHLTRLRYNIKQYNQGLLKIIAKIEKLSELSMDIKNEMRITFMKKMHKSIFKKGLKSIAFDKKEDADGAYEMLNNLHINAPKTTVFNSIYQLGIFGKLLLDFLRILQSIRKILKKNFRKIKYNEFRELIDCEMSINDSNKRVYRT